MTDTFQILDAIRSLAEQAVPELREVHLELLPREPAYPCLLIRSVSSEMDDAAKALVQVRERAELVVMLCGEEERGEGCPRDTDPEGVPQSCVACLLQLESKLLALFRHGYLKVGDRALPVKAGKGDSALREGRIDDERRRLPDRAVVDLQLDYLDLRTTEQVVPLMETVETKVISKG